MTIEPAQPDPTARAEEGGPAPETEESDDLSGKTDSTELENDDTLEEMNRLRAERDAAVAALDKRGQRQRRLARGRRILVGFLVVVFAVILPLTTIVVWAHNTVLNTDGWVRTVRPIGSDPAVTAVVSREVTDELFTALNAQGQIAGALPPKASFLAAPITNGVRGYVLTAVNQALSAQQFRTLWANANRFAHAQLVSVLRGNREALSTTDGQVVLNLVPLLNQALQQIEPFVSGVVGKPISLPTISGNELPAQACQKISSALGRPLPATCGQIPLFPADKLTQAQRLVRVFDGVTILLLVLTPVVAALALWISKRRRRTLLELSVGGILGLVVVRRALWWLQGDLVNVGKSENKAARQAILHQVTHGLFTASGWIIVGLAVVLLIALVSGPYEWATKTRSYLAEAGQQAWALAVATFGKVRDETTITWVRDHIGPLQIAGVVVAILVMLIFSVSFLGFIIIAALVVLYELWLRRLQTRAESPEAVDLPTATGGTGIGDGGRDGHGVRGEQPADSSARQGDANLLP